MSFFSDNNIDLTTGPRRRESRGGSTTKIFEDKDCGFSIHWGVQRYADSVVGRIEHNIVTIDFESIQITVDENVVGEQLLRAIVKAQPWRLSSRERTEQEALQQTSEQDRSHAAHAAFVAEDFALAFKLSPRFVVDQIIARVVNVFGLWLMTDMGVVDGAVDAAARFMSVITIIAKLRTKDCENARHAARLETKQELRKWLGIETFISSGGFNP